MAGRRVAASIIHGGPGFPHFPTAIFAYFQNPTPNDVVDHLTQDVVDADDLDTLTKVLIAMRRFKQYQLCMYMLPLNARMLTYHCTFSIYYKKKAEYAKCCGLFQGPVLQQLHDF